MREKPFKFVIGDDGSEVFVHPSVIKRVSQPMYTMKTNGHMEESLIGEAKLPLVEPETFAAFLEDAYTRLYTVASQDDDQDGAIFTSLFDMPFHSSTEYHCRSCGRQQNTADMEAIFPFCAKTWKDAFEVVGDILADHHCAKYGKVFKVDAVYTSSMLKMYEKRLNSTIRN